jgi:hypothetical protein
VNAKAAETAAAQPRIDEGDIHFTARTTSTIGRPSHCR